MKKFTPNMWVKFNWNGLTTVGITKTLPSGPAIIFLNSDGACGCISWDRIDELELLNKLSFIPTPKDNMVSLYDTDIAQIFDDMQKHIIKIGEA